MRYEPEHLAALHEEQTAALQANAIHFTAMRDVLFGPRGLRAGWRVVLFVVVLLAWALVIGKVWHAVMPAPSHATQMWPHSAIIGESALVVILILTLGVLSLLDGTSTSAYGLPASGIISKRFFAGVLGGFLGLTLVLVLMRIFHGYYFGVVTGNVAFEARFAVEWAVAFLLVGFAEEVLLRSYLLFSLARGLGFWIAAVITSVIFALAHVHNPGETPLGIGAVFIVGMLFCFFVRRTGDLWFPIGFHAAWDWAESYFYGVPDSGTVSAGTLLHPSFSGATWLSGGSAGPEGSAICYIVIALLAIACHLLYPQARYRFDMPLHGPVNPLQPPLAVGTPTDTPVDRRA